MALDLSTSLASHSGSPLCKVTSAAWSRCGLLLSPGDRCRGTILQVLHSGEQAELKHGTTAVLSLERVLLQVLVLMFGEPCYQLLAP